MLSSSLSREHFLMMASWDISALSSTRPLDIGEWSGETLCRGECVALIGSAAACASRLRTIERDGWLIGGRLVLGGFWPQTGISEARLSALRHTIVGRIGHDRLEWPDKPIVEIVAASATAAGRRAAVASVMAQRLLTAQRVSQRVWHANPSALLPATRQKVEIAAGLVIDHPVLLLDNPLSGLEPEGQEAAIRLLLRAKRNGAVLIGILDDVARAALADRVIQVDAAH